MKLKLLTFIFVISLKFCAINSADLFDDQPKILVNDGNLVFESAESKNVSIQLKGKSRFLINNIDILEAIDPSNGSNVEGGGGSNSETIAYLSSQVARLRSMMRGQNGILNRLDRVESGIPANATIPGGLSDRSRINGLNRRVVTLEQRVANLTERLMRDHCKSYPCQNGGTCFNMFETFRCECPGGWEGPTCSLDVDECSRFAGTDLGCQNGATCFNHPPGSYQCLCTDQWKGKNCNRKQVDCLQVPQSETCGHGTCVQANNKLGFTCICEQGWRKSNITESCSLDVDECTEMRPHCSENPKVFCINTPGSFVCGPCPRGFTGNGFSCQDVNECEINNGGCSVSPKVECFNTDGSYRCGNCPLGYNGDGRTCTPGGERTNLQCTDSSICNENAQCIQYPNSQPICNCKQGFVGNGFGEDGCVVSASDPCNALRCKNGGTCLKNGSLVYCACPPGFLQPLCERAVDNCASRPCLNGGNCTSLRFGRRYICTCPRGFTGSNCQSQARRCGGLRDTENGTLRYPTDPSTTYYHNSRCAWLIKTNHTKVLNVTFQKFDLEDSRDCKFDWLQIHDGRSSSSYMIGRFCGHDLPKGGNIISTHNQLYLWFRSDNSTAHDGFELSWESIDPICGGDLNVTTHGTISSPGSPGNYPINRDCEWFITAPPGKRIQFLFFTLMIEAHQTCAYDYVEVHSGLGTETPSLGKYCNTTNPPPLLTPSHTATIHFHSDGDSNDAGFQIAYSVVEGFPGCGGTYTSAKGDIVSPTNIEDGKYKHNIICDYVIQLPKESRVRIEFKKFALEDSSSCKFDRVEIFEGNSYDEESLIGRYCGDSKPPIITSQTNIVTVKFTSDWSSNDEGFQFQYQLVCGGIFTAETGTFSSPNYPNPYSGERNCEFDISAPQGKVIVLNVLDFEIEAHSLCEFDYLEIFDGFQSDNATSLGRFCGLTRPGVFSSTFNHMHVHFSSDASINGRGFSANYSFVDVECGGIVKDASELIKSPMDTDGNGMYKSNANCRWLVYAPKGHVIQMNFINFDLELDTACKYDSVTIYNNGSGMGDPMGPFCGTNAPKVITTTDNIATVVFKTDSSTARDGFTISLSFIDGSRLCGGHYFATQGVIRSPGKPEYFPNKECEWFVTVPNGQQIELIFNYFDIEQHSTCRFDGLEIRNGGNSFAPLIGKFCGTDLPEGIKSFGNQLYFKFYSDSSRGGKGFEIEYDGTSTGCGGRLTSTKGSISSPNYPKPYAHNAQCEWRISVNEGSTIEIIFTDLDMETQSTCSYDYLEIFDGSDASAKSYGKFCSSDSHPMHLLTTGNHALLRMRSDDSHAGRGFFLKYSIHCNRTIRMDSGVIESPNFPNDYPNNLDCAWTIVVTKGNRINMQFSHFYLENDNQFHNETNEHICKYDYLEIADVNFETKTEQGQKLKYCNSAPEIRTSTGDSFNVVFHTDASASGAGFRLEWYIEGCGGKMFRPEGTITSPNYPKRYNHDVTCLWEINVEYGYKIEVLVQDLEIEQSSPCQYDFLAFSTDPSFNTTIMKVCHTQQTPTVLTSDSHKLYIKFKSDESNNGKGFNLTYRSVLSDCGGTFLVSNIIISTPKYPTQNYENNKNCEWNIKTDPSQSLIFQFIDFDLELSDNCTKDYVEIYDPIFDSVLWRGCGNQMPNQTVFRSQRNQLNVRLVTDQDITAKGFSGNFTNNCGARIVTNDTGDFRYQKIFSGLDDTVCVWTIIADDPVKKVTVTFTYINIYLDLEGCLSKIEVFDGDSDQGSLKTTFCGSKTPPAITSNGNALTVKLNSSSMNFLSEFDIHYTVLDNFCGGTYSSSVHGEFGSPGYPSSSPLNSYCIWTISASAGNKMALTVKNIDIAISPSCNDNYLEIRKNGPNGPLVGVFCGNNIPENLEVSQKFWIKFKTDSVSTSNGFLASFKYVEHSEIDGESGSIESPNYPKYLKTHAKITYRVTVKQGSVIRIEFPTFSMEEEDGGDDCFTYVKIFNGYDETAPLLQDETCSEEVQPITSEANVVFIEFLNSHISNTKFQLTWKEVDKVFNTSFIENECGDKAIALVSESSVVNITSPGYPDGYASGLLCTWTIVSTLPSFHPIVVFKDVDLEDVTDCVGDYVSVSGDRDDGSWKEFEKICVSDLRQRKMFEGTPNLRLTFKTDYGVNRTGFSAYTHLECGGKMTDGEGIIEYNTTNLYSLYRINNDCKWNITVRRGKTIQFEFLTLNIQNTSDVCNSYVTIRNGIDGASPYLGVGQYCGKFAPKIPPTSSNHAFVKYKVNIPMLNSFRLRYYEIQHDCGGTIKLLSSNSSAIISSPNYPNIPPPHIDCTWTILAPIGERIRVDFLERFDISYAQDCEKEYVELRDGTTKSSQVIGTFCNEKPTTKKSTSNVLMVKFFTDVAEPKNGFKANISIDICGGTSRSNIGFLTSPNYPGLGAYPSKVQCEYRITCAPNHIFLLTVVDIDLPPLNETECDRKQDHVTIYSIIPDFNSTGEESFVELGTFCGNVPPSNSFLSDTNEVLVKFNTADKTKSLFKGFKLFYNASKISCGGNIDGESGVITSPGYPSKTLNKLFCEWKITVPKGRRVKIEFVDVDLLNTNNQFLQRIGVYNDFRYSNRLKFITNSSLSEPLYSSDNRMMVTMWVRTPSTNRGFKLKFSSDSTTICAGSLNDMMGTIFPPLDLNLTSYTCDYLRDLKPIYGDSLSNGTIAYNFREISVGKKISNCRYASTVINVKRRSGENEDESFLARICGNTTKSLTVLSPFPDVSIEVRQNPFFGQVNFTMFYTNNECGGLLLNGGVNTITNPRGNNSTYQKVLDCAWFVKYDEGYSVSMSIINLSLKLPCDQEYLQIYNGPTALSPMIGKYCGSEFSKQVMVSQRNTIFIEYHTNNFFDVSKDSVFEIKLEPASFGCGGILNKNNFKFKSPLYDKGYPANTECIWEIRADPGYHIGLSFNDRFFLEDSVNCTKDYLEVFDFVNEEWVSKGRRCGRIVPTPFNSTGQTMKVVFRSDETTNGDGFSAEWVQNCGGIFSVDRTTKLLSSPGYPKLYGPNLYCNYTLVSSVPQAFINVNFLDFAVETTGSKCMYDNITIYKNPDYVYSFSVAQEKVGTYCGISNPGKFRHRDVSTIIFRSDRWVERKGFQIEYRLDDCGGDINNSTMIASPNIIKSTTYVGTLSCIWNITAPEGKKIIIKFENFTMENSDYCSFDFVELFNGTTTDKSMRLAKICGNLTNSIRPIMINNNHAVLMLKTDQLNEEFGFTAAITFTPNCDETIYLSSDNPSYMLDKSNKEYIESRECVYKVVADPLSVIKITFNELHLSICDPDRDTNQCNCDYVEILDGNGPFSETIGRYCGHGLPQDVISTRSAVYIRYVIDSVRPSTGFKAQVSMIQSLCGATPYRNFTGNETEDTYFVSPGIPNYPPNIRCMWIAEAPVGKIFEIIFNKFELEDSPMCSADKLTLTDDYVKDTIPEGLGEEIVYRGKSTSMQTPSFYSGISGPTAPHIYCGNVLPHEYISQTHKIRINFESNSEKQYAGFNFTIRTLKECSRNFTSLQGRIVNTDNIQECKTSIKVPANYTISLYFNRFYFHESDCKKSFLKIYDGDFENGVLLRTLCGYAMPNPVFSTKNELSLFFHFDDSTTYYSKGNYDILYLATDKGQGCGGTFFNYGGLFTSPLYPNVNRTLSDCTWTVIVPQNLKVALRFSTFDMGSKLMCESDYVEFLEENDQGEMRSIKKFCGEDDPAIYVSTRSKVFVHYAQTLNFAGTGWILNFIGVHEGSSPQNW